MSKAHLLSLALVLFTFTISAQTESSSSFSQSASKDWMDGGAQSVTENMEASAPLPHPAVREADILWEKRIWRVVDTREKINLPFRHPDKGLFNVLLLGIKSNQISAFSAEDDHFSTVLTTENLDESLSSSDTVNVWNMDTDQYDTQIVHSKFDPDRINRWRIQEVWYFDSRHSKMQVRIIGIAPIIEEKSEHENTTLYEMPLFWINYDQARPWLAQHAVTQFGNDHSQMSWEDLFAMRRFSSHIYQENDMLGRRLKDYANGPDLLLNAEKIEQQIQNYEQDVWSY